MDLESIGVWLHSGLTDSWIISVFILWFLWLLSSCANQNQENDENNWQSSYNKKYFLVTFIKETLRLFLVICYRVFWLSIFFVLNDAIVIEHIHECPFLIHQILRIDLLLNSHLNVPQVPLVVWCHIKHCIVFFHNESSKQPSILQFVMHR